MNRVSLSIAVLSASSILFAASSKAAPTSPESTITVSLPTADFNPSVPSSTVIIQPVVTTNIDPSLNYVAFQGDFTFDSAVVSFSYPYIEGAGLTATGWNFSGHIYNTGPGTIKTLRLADRRRAGGHPGTPGWPHNPPNP
jgi:hypothetical protein